MDGLQKIVYVTAFCCLSITILLISFNSSFGGSIIGYRLWPRQANPLCSNLLCCVTNGRWVRVAEEMDNTTMAYTDLIKREEEFDSYMNKFRIERGIHTRLWKDNQKCGIKNLQGKPQGNRWGGDVGSWCDARSDKPCCSDEDDGICGNNCECTRCVDMRKIHHAEFSRWVPNDPGCMLRNYTAVAACKIVKRFSEIHFVGDSFVRKMARGFILTLRSDPTYGAISKHGNNKLKKSCVGVDQFYWTECRLGDGDLQKITLDNRTLCGMESERLSAKTYFSLGYAGNYLNFIKRLAGKKGSIVFLGVGGHMNCDFKVTSEKYLGPAVKFLNEFYKERNISDSTKWPRVVFMFPDTPGLLKAPVYRPQNGKIPCYKFAEEMKAYCQYHGIAVLDFRKLTTGVHSYDGTHHGLGVNLMKVQLLLNYLDSISEGSE